jgi:outer membrane immunogenic protein
MRNASGVQIGLLCASIAAMAFTASAMLAPAAAADLSVAPIYMAPPAPVSIWTGAYVGGAGAGTWGSAVVRNDVTGFDQAPAIDLSGGIFGVTAGLNWQNGNVVLGFEGDASGTSKSASVFDFPPSAGFSNEIRERWLSTFRGRLGYTQDNWLVYATAGVALANVQAGIAGPGGTIAQNQGSLGFAAGGGVELKLNPDWSAKVEYLYVGLQDKTYFNPAPSLAFPANQRAHIDDHLVRFGVNYKLPWNVLDSFYRR